MAMLALMHMPRSMLDGHHPFPWLLYMPFYKSKWTYVYDQRVLSLVKVSFRPRLVKLHRWNFFLISYLSSMLKNRYPPNTLSFLEHHVCLEYVITSTNLYFIIVQMHGTVWYVYLYYTRTLVSLDITHMCMECIAPTKLYSNPIVIVWHCMMFGLRKCILFTW